MKMNFLNFFIIASSMSFISAQLVPLTQQQQLQQQHRQNQLNQRTCGYNEEFNSCGSACPLNCDNYMLGVEPRGCNKMCVPGCFCRFGYVRDLRTNQCVLTRECLNNNNNNIGINNIYNRDRNGYNGYNGNNGYDTGYGRDGYNGYNGNIGNNPGYNSGNSNNNRYANTRDTNYKHRNAYMRNFSMSSSISVSLVVLTFLRFLAIMI